MIAGTDFFDQPRKKMIYKGMIAIRKIETGQGDNYTTGCLLHYPYFKKYYKLIAIYCKQQELDADPKAIQQINFTGNIKRVEGAKISFIIEEAK